MKRQLLNQRLLSFKIPGFLILIFLSLLALSQHSYAQLTLSGVTYQQDFNGIASGLPTGWSVRTGANASALGTNASFIATATAWSTTTGQFANMASANSPAASTDNSTVQGTRTDRAPSVRQGGSFGDPGAAFVLQIANTTGLSAFTLSFKLMELDPTATVARTTTWNVDYGFGATPTSFTNATTVPVSLTTFLGSGWGTTNVTVDFGSLLDNNAGPVWIRICAKTGSSGGGSRPQTAIDDFTLNWSAAPAPLLSAVYPSLSFGNQTVLISSSALADSLSGINLTGSFPDNILITSPSNDFQVSTDGSSWGQTAQIQFSSATLVKTIFYVQFTPQSYGLKQGDITFSGGGVVSPPTVHLTGFGVDPSTPLLYSVTGSAYNQNFNGLPVTGGPFTPASPSYLSGSPVLASGMVGWQFGSAIGGGTRFAADNGGSGTGSAYSYGTTSAADRSLGSLAGTVVSNLGLVLTNFTADILTNVTISYTGEQWRRGAGLANTLSFSYAVGASSISSGTFTPVPALNFTAPITTGTDVALDGNAAANKTVIAPQTFVLNTNWLPGQNLVIRWDDVNEAGGTDDGLAIDDFSFSATPPLPPTRQDSTITITNLSTFSLTANWLLGNGSGRVVMMNTFNSFVDPANGSTPSANSHYSGSNQQVIYNGTGNSVNVTGLVPGQQYFFRVYAYNGSGISTAYSIVTAPDNPKSVTTISQANPNHLVVTSVNGGVSPFAYGPFYIVVESRDASNYPQNLLANTNLTVSLLPGNGNGIVGGTFTDQMDAGTYIDTIYGITYNIQDFGVKLTVSRTSGDVLTAADTPPFNVLSLATQLTFSGVPAAQVVNTTLPSFTVQALTSDPILDVNYAGDIAITIAVGPAGGMMNGTTTRTAVGGIATFNDIQFTVPGTYYLEANALDLFPASTNAIVITNQPSLIELVVPKYMGSKTTSSENHSRTPIAVCFQVDNLFPNTSYDVRAGLDTANAPATSYGAGNLWSGAAYNTSNILNAFITDATGSSQPFWIFLQPTGNGDRFGGGQVHNIRLSCFLHGSLSPTVPNFVTSKTITSLDIATTPSTSTGDDGAYLRGISSVCADGKYILVYDNVDGTGSPLYSYQARQAIPVDATASSYSSLPAVMREIYMQNGSSAIGSWPAIIPIGANNSNGVRRIEARNSDNTIFSASTDADGVWPSGANTTTVGRIGVVSLTLGDASLTTVSITNITSTPAGCVGSNDNGTATVTATGNGVLSYSWNSSPVQTTATATGLASGTYTVTVTDASGCSATASVMVNQPLSSTIVPGGPTTFCAGGSVTLSVPSGATSYSWSSNPSGDISNSIVVTTSGSYTVTVTTPGCIQTSLPVVVTVNSFAYNGTILSESMGQPASGTPAVGNYTGWQNQAPITFSSTSSSQADVRKSNPFIVNPGVSDSGNVFFTSSGARNFIVSGINTQGYSGIVLSFELNRESGTTADPMVVGVSSDGTNYTSLTITQPAANSTWGLVTASGTIPATSNLRIRFSKSGSTSSYRLDDVKLIGTTSTVSIAPPGPLTICSGASIYLTSNILTGNTWSPTIETTKSITVSSAGTYTVTAVSTNGCSATSDPVNVSVNPSPSVSILFTNDGCFGANNGSAQALASGGTPTYGYSWNTTPVQNFESASNLAPGTYTVTATDNNGCTATATAVIAQLNPLLPTATFTNATCIGANDGTATATPSGGTGPYAFSWSATPTVFTVTHVVKDATHPYFGVGSAHGYAINGIQGKEITLVRGVTYTFIVDPSNAGHPFHIATDPTGGSFVNEVTSGELPSGGVDNGILTFTPDGSHPSVLYYACGVHQFMGYIINIVDPATSPAITGLSPGSYDVTVTDANGCIASETVTIADGNTPCGGNVTLHMNLFLEGYYVAPGTPTPMDGGNGGCLFLGGFSPDGFDADSVRINLVDSIVLANTGDSALATIATRMGVLHTDGVLSFDPSNAVVFPSSVVGNKYYLKITQRNHLETWSSWQVMMTSPVTTYDFTSGFDKAFEFEGNPFHAMKQMEPGKWAIYSGDLNQDNFTDIFDITPLVDDLSNNPFGYYPSDMNGDGLCDIFDITGLTTNLDAGIYSQHP